jgi:DNA repair exonuclease SbcCD ATPase subunit
MPYAKAEDRRKHARIWREKNREKIRAYHSTRKQNPNHRKACQKAQQKYRQLHPEQARISSQLSRLRKDGVSERELMLAKNSLAQFDGKCGVCGTNNPEHERGFTLDHDHQTKKFRGIVCGHCNSAMGLTMDNPKTLRLLAEWIERGRE